MTTFIQFQPQSNAAPPFQAPVTLDGSTYNLACFWSLVSARWYFSLTDQMGVVIYSGAMTGSPDDYDFLLAPSVFQTSTILYRETTGNIEINP